MKEEYDFEPEQMSLATFKTVVDQMKEFPERFKVLSLTGHGEPLMNPQLPEMIAYAKENNIAERIEFITNASLLTPKRSDRLIAAGLDCLRISMQGLSAAKYAHICRYQINFDHLMENISYFFNNKQQCKLYVKIMDVALEAGEENKFYELFGHISDRMFIEQCRPVYSGVEMTRDIETTADRYGHEHPPRMVCPLCFYMMGVLPNGDVKPCDAIYKPVILGNIYHQKLLAMWQGKELREFRTRQLLKKRCENKSCGVCCAPDDVSHPEDALDEQATRILERL